MTSNSHVQQARSIYNISQWSEGLFDLNEQGQLCVLEPKSDHQHSLENIIDACQQQGVQLPVLLRFPHIIKHKVQQLCDCFQQAINQQQYQGQFLAVYPIKVNQQHKVVDHVVKAQLTRQPLALEAGSKPELLTIIAEAQKNTHKQAATLICNGYKDAQYIRLALMAKKMGHHCILVVEKADELAMIASISQELNIKASIGVRARLASIGKGNWQNTGGEKSKFGLTAQQLLSLIADLKQNQMLDCLELLHFQLGSQIANIADIQMGLTEASQFFIQLSDLGANIGYIDVGGGLGVDYEGTNSRSACSINYSVQEYANNVVASFAQACQQQQLPHPIIISESGRAVSAHHAVLISNVTSIETRTHSHAPDFPQIAPQAAIAQQQLLQSMAQLTTNCQQLSIQQPKLAQEYFHDLSRLQQDAKQLFSNGLLTLQQRAYLEQSYYYLLGLIKPCFAAHTRSHQSLLQQIDQQLASKLFVNFSLFQSLPDVWGIKQIFPILPLSGLDQALSQRVVIQDITCDSDGRIDDYVDGEGIEQSLPWPKMQQQANVGFFMLGAYQEILGDMHNLFGDTAAVDIDLLDSSIKISHIEPAQTVASVLEYVNYDPKWLQTAFAQQLDSHPEKQQLLQMLNQSLQQSTYLEPKT